MNKEIYIKKLNKLSNDLTKSMAKDFFSFRQKLNHLKKYISSKSKNIDIEEMDKKIKKLTLDISNSLKIVQKRKLSIPAIFYPDDLPVSLQKEKIKELINNNQVVVIAGDTGSGKSTQIPKICLELGRGTRGLIGHTQPRRIATRCVASRVAKELNVNLGDEVGYKIRFHDKTNRDSLIKVMTDGILLQEAHFDKYLIQYDTIIIDEAHERNLNVDFLLGIIKRILPIRKDLKIIITSATIDPEKFSKFFDNAPMVLVEGRTYPVEILYQTYSGKFLPSDKLGDEENEYKENKFENKDGVKTQESNLDIIKAINFLDNNKVGDILIFLSGEREIHDLVKDLKQHKWKYPTEILPLYSRLSIEQQNKIFVIGRHRRIILSTNVAETSLTVPGILYVIDLGKARLSRYNYKTQIQRLPIESISKASAQQRAGRCGRTAPGICIRMYPYEDYVNRVDFTSPEILRTNLASIILQIYSLELGDIRKFETLDMPDEKYIKDGYRALTQIKALDANNNLTPLGAKLAKIPLDPKLGAMLFLASKLGSLEEILIITSFLAVLDPRERSKEFKMQAQEKHSRFDDNESDFISLINLWNYIDEKWNELSKNKFKILCKKEFLSYVRILDLRETHKQLVIIAKEHKLIFNKTKAEYSQIHKALLSGLIMNVGFLDSENNSKSNIKSTTNKHNKNKSKIYLGVKGKKFQIFPINGLKGQIPKWIVAFSLFETEKIYALTVAKIYPEWIVEVGSHLLKYSYSDPFWSSKTGFVYTKENANLFGLTIYHNKRVSYDKINKANAREIFIRSALVERNLESTLEFWQHNNKIIEQINDLENKIRKQDILVDDEVLYEFYNSKLPLNISSVKDLNKWLQKHDQSQLFLTQENLVKRDALEITKDSYPDYFLINNKRYKLEYCFDPSNKCDGITIIIPAKDILNLEKDYFEWLVPGMLHEKITLLIKSLPKSIRTNFIPASHFSNVILERLKNYDVQYNKLNLISVISKELTKITGVKIPNNAWKKEQLPAYLQMNFKIVDNLEKKILEDRSFLNIVEALKKVYSNNNGNVAFEDVSSEDNEIHTESVSKYNVSKDNVSKESVCNDNIASILNQKSEKYTSWNFSDLKEKITLVKENVEMPAYLALVDKNDHVVISVFVDKNIALNNHVKGLCRLFLLQDPKKIKYLQKNIKDIATLTMLYKDFGSKQTLIDELLKACAYNTFLADFDNKNAIMTKSQFENRLNINKENLISEFNLLISIVREVLLKYKEIKELMVKYSAILKKQTYISADIVKQLSLLLSKNFITQTSFEYLSRIPVYLETIIIRLNRLKEKPGADLKLAQQILPLINDFYNNLSKLPLDDEYVDSFRWMLEEYRVAVFAQILKTKDKINAKKLKNIWDKIQDKYKLKD